MCGQVAGCRFVRVLHYLGTGEVHSRERQFDMEKASPKPRMARWLLVPTLLLGCGISSATGTDPETAEGPLANECQGPGEGWIWCDDFDQDRLGAYFEYDSEGGAFERANGVGAEGSWGMRARFSAGQVDAGELHLAMGRTPSAYFAPVDEGSADYREIYYRVYLRTQPGWIGGSGWKFSRATVFASAQWAQAMIAHVWGGNSDYLTIDPARGTDSAGNLRTTEYNDFDNLSWLGSEGSNTAIFDAAHAGGWHCFETQVKLNDPGSANGVFRLWIDGSLEAERTGLNFLGDYDAYGINAVFLENWWNPGSPVDQERYFDNFVISTRPIGCPESTGG
jgi:hypothetical protein